MTTVTHTMCAMEPRTGRSKARTVTDTLSRSRFITVATAQSKLSRPAAFRQELQSQLRFYPRSLREKKQR